MKIPFERTVSSAYSFAFRNILQVIGIAWFPYFVLGAAMAALLYEVWPTIKALIDSAAADKQPDPMLVRRMALTIFAAYGVMVPLFIVASAMVSVGLLRQALGQFTRPVFIFFSLGGQVWRLIGAQFLLTLGIIVVLAASSGIVIGTWFLMNAKAQPWEWLVTVLLGLVLACGFIYAAVRISFFVPAIVVAENRIGFGRAWTLGGGNFWRIVGVLLVITLPIGFVASTISSSVMQFVVLSQMGMGPPSAGAPPGPRAAAEFLSVFGNIAGFLVALQFVHTVILAGLNAGAVASAYRFVTEDEGAPPAAEATA